MRAARQAAVEKLAHARHVADDAGVVQLGSAERLVGYEARRAAEQHALVAVDLAARAGGGVRLVPVARLREKPSRVGEARLADLLLCDRAAAIGHAADAAVARSGAGGALGLGGAGAALAKSGHRRVAAAARGVVKRAPGFVLEPVERRGSHCRRPPPHCQC